jgi:nucleoside-diphosphate-sugar epimerase
MSFELSGKRILVTGATGFIGSHVTQRLLHGGNRVRAMVRNAQRAKFLADEGAEVVLGDVTDRNVIEDAVRGCQVIFHFAAALSESKPWSYFRLVNVEGTRVLAEFAIKEHVERFIFASTVWVYGFDARRDINEASDRHPSGDPYCDTKLESENLIRRFVKEQNLPAIIIQPSEVYGPRDESWTLGPIRRIKSGRMILINNGNGLIHPIFIDDLVDGVLAAACHGKVGESYILCGQEIVTLREYYGYFAHMVGKEKMNSVSGAFLLAVATLAEWLAAITKRPPFLRKGSIQSEMLQATYSGKKAYDHLDFLPKTTIKEGMRRTEEWLRSCNII